MKRKYSKRQLKAIDHGFEVLGKMVHQAVTEPEVAPEFAVILPFDPDLLAKIFTRQRLRLWEELHKGKPKSLTELAGRLDRNVSRVRQDLLLLERAGLARLEKHGTRVSAVAQAPQIVIAPPP